MTHSTLRLYDEDTEENIVLAGSVLTSADPILVISNEINFPSPRVVNQDRLGRSGKRDWTVLHDSAVFSAELKVQGDATYSRHTTLEQIRGMLHPRRRPYLYIEREGWGAERRAQLRGDSVSCVVDHGSSRFLEVSIQAEIPEGVLESGEVGSVAFAPGGLTPTGLDTPADTPWEITAGVGTNVMATTVLGNTLTPPYFRVYGGCTSPSFTVVYADETSKTIYLRDLVINSGSYVDIDVANRLVYGNSNLENNYYYKLDFSTSSWWELEPGLQTVVFGATSADATCHAEMQYYDRWIGG